MQLEPTMMQPGVSLRLSVSNSVNEGKDAAAGRPGVPLWPRSPQSKLVHWTKSNMVPKELRGSVMRLLMHSLYSVPKSGLFTLNHSTNVGMAIPRYDIVQTLVQPHQSLDPYRVVLVEGLRRTGMTFSVPWALVEAIRIICQEQRTGENSSSESVMAGAFSSSSGIAVAAADGSSSGSAQEAAPSSSSGGVSSSSTGGSGTDCSSNEAIQRVSHIMLVECDQMEQPSINDQKIFLAVAAYLEIPVIFKRWHRWNCLAGAMHHFLLDRRLDHLQYLSPQFILLDSLQDKMADHPAWRDGVIRARSNVGVAPIQRMPQPPLQMIAGMLQHKHSSLYPEQLLGVISRIGYRLDILSSNRPYPPLEELHLKGLKDAVLIEGKLLSALHSLVEKGYALWDKNEGAWGLWDLGLLTIHRWRDKFMFLDDPQLIMVKSLQKAFNGDGEVESEAKLQQLRQPSEGKVLKLLTRRSLLPVIAERLGLTGRYQSVWGCVVTVKPDFALMFPDGDGPVVWGSCKRQQKHQTMEAFTKHITALLELAEEKADRLPKPLAKYMMGSNRRAEVQQEYDYDDAVVLSRCLLNGRGLMLVGVSLVPAGPEKQCLRGAPEGGKLLISVNGKEHSIQYSYHHMLFTDLVQPMTAEPCQVIEKYNLLEALAG